MKVACHQPNFVPYLGFFEKMNKADVFVLSDTVLYSRKAFFNYNYVFDGHNVSKITVPINAHMTSKLNEITLSEWEVYGKRITKSLQCIYGRAQYSPLIMPKVAHKLSQEFTKAVDLNIEFIRLVKEELGIECELILESSLHLDSVEKNQDIVNICKALNADTYISGEGGKEYMNLDLFANNGIAVEFSSSDYPKYSVLDHLFRHGGGNLWKKK